MNEITAPAPGHSSTAAPRRKRIRRGPLTGALVAVTGLLAIGAPAAAQASAAAPSTLTASLSLTAAAKPSVVNPNGNQRSYNLGGQFSGCTFVVGDQYHISGGAIGEADLNCGRAHTVRIKVYLDYLTTNGTLRTYREYSAGAPFYGANVDVWTGCAADVGAFWTTYAKVSIDGSPYSGLFSSKKNVWYQAGSC